MRLVVRPVVLLILGWLMTGPVVAAEPLPEQAQALVQALGDEAVAVLADSSLNATGQAERMRQIFREYFAVDEIGRFVLSRYWRSATPEQPAEYLRLFEDLIVYGYARRFTGYTGEQLRVLGARVEGTGGTTVQSAVAAAGSANQISVDWHVAEVNGRPQIVDVVVEGVSLKLTQRSDFTGLIKQKGGSVAGLIEALRDKTQSLRAEIAKG